MDFLSPRPRLPEGGGYRCHWNQNEDRNVKLMFYNDQSQNVEILFSFQGYQITQLGPKARFNKQPKNPQHITRQEERNSLSLRKFPLDY
jgi:hypothetical protein